MKIDPYWLSGFVDGEGCFFVGINKSDTMSIGYQILPEFRIVQHKCDIQLLYAIKTYFKCGSVVGNKGLDSDVYEYRVRGITNLNNYIVPFFDKYELKTVKKFDFLKFKEVLSLMSENKHLTEEGFQKIVSLKKSMNRSNNYLYLDKDIVRT